MKKIILVLILSLLLVGCKDQAIHINQNIDQIKSVDEMGMAAFHMDGKWGYLSVESGVVVAAVFDYIESYKLGYSVVYDRGRSQLINRQGELMMEGWIDGSIKYDEEKNEYNYFSYEDSVIVSIDLPILEEVKPYEDDPFNRLYIEDYEYDIVNNYGNLRYKETGKLLFEKYYQTLRERYCIQSEEGNYHYFLMHNKDSFGFSEIHNGEVKIIVEGDYDYGWLYGEENCIVMRRGDRRWLYNFDGDILLETDGVETDLGDIVSDDLISYKKNDKWGYINVKSDKQIVGHLYDQAIDFSNGYAVVKKDSKTHMIIDTSGHIVIAADLQEAN